MTAAVTQPQAEEERPLYLQALLLAPLPLSETRSHYVDLAVLDVTEVYLPVS